MAQAMNVIPVLLWLSFEALAAPYVFYTDLDRGPSAPKNGGGGVFITIYGNRFGESRNEGTVTIGGLPPASYLSWSNTKIVIRLGSQNRPGRDLPIVVTVRGQPSNQDVLFTIDNAHRIYYFDPNAAGSRRDSCSKPAKGTESAPWRYLREPLSPRDANYYVNKCVGNGDILYFRAGTLDTRDGIAGWQHSVLVFDRGVAWLAVAAYPGESVVLDGSRDNKIKDTLVSRGYATGLVIAGLHLIGGTLNVMPGMPPGRLVGNLITGPNSCNYDALGVTSQKGGIVFGNEITDVGTKCNSGEGPTKLMHSIYMGCNDCEVAWNYIHGNKTYNGIQFHNDRFASTGGFYNISIHDNWIQGQYGSGINLSTIDFPKGSEYIRVYNNVLFGEGAVALAHWESPGGQVKSCIALKDFGRKSAKGTVEVYNNTMADCTGLFNDQTSGGTVGSGAIYKGGTQTGVTLRLTNNAVYAPPYYWTDAARGSKQQSAYIAVATATCCAAQISGTNNLWYGFGDGPGSLTANVNANPMFTLLAAPDFHPREGNPALGGGVPVPWIKTDRDGVPRPAHPAIGAYEAAP